MTAVYLDACCLNRPFDDQTQERIRLESEAVLLILGRCEAREWELLGSEVIDYELSRIPNADRRRRAELLASIAASKLLVTDKTERRAAQLQARGFHWMDALHLACREEGKADALLTTDDRLLRQTERERNDLVVPVANPIQWLLEAVDHEA